MPIGYCKLTKPAASDVRAGQFIMANVDMSVGQQSVEVETPDHFKWRAANYYQKHPYQPVDEMDSRRWINGVMFTFGPLFFLIGLIFCRLTYMMWRYSDEELADKIVRTIIAAVLTIGGILLIIFASITDFTVRNEDRVRSNEKRQSGYTKFLDANKTLVGTPEPSEVYTKSLDTVNGCHADERFVYEF